MIELYKGGNCMPKVNMVELLKKAKEEKYAVPLINIDTLEWLHAVMDTAQRLQSPIIIGTAPFQVERLGGVHTVVGMIDGLVKDKGYTIPYVIHLDHGSSFDWCKKAIDAGFTSVMIDASKYDLDTNDIELEITESICGEEPFAGNFKLIRKSIKTFPKF